MTSVYLQSSRSRNAITAGFKETEWISGPIWSIPLAPSTQSSDDVYQSVSCISARGGLHAEGADESAFRRVARGREVAFRLSLQLTTQHLSQPSALLWNRLMHFVAVANSLQPGILR
jgi:hypothetical protein